jgi:50S ribosomal protein L16 3-hydroxylase
MKVIEFKSESFDKKFFLDNYWGKIPVLIRGMFSENLSLIEPDELAGLACEEGIESRIVSEIINDNKSTWVLENGPFEEAKFQLLPNKNWSLLVQSVDHWNTGVADLLTSFRFLPAHILDDIMVSFAPEGGSVGPHFDYYDVFLVQGLGARSWKIGQQCDSSSPVSIHSQLLILDNFIEVQSFDLKTGDVLYLPPKVAHWGIALEDCITYSVGFRTPSVSQSIIAFTDALTETLEEDKRLSFNNSNNPYEINASTIADLKKQLQTELLNDNKLIEWYGKFATEPKNENTIVPLENQLSEQTLLQKLKKGYALLKNEGSRFIFQEETIYKLFVDGESYALEKKHAELMHFLCEGTSYHGENIILYFEEKPLADLLVTLVNKGSLYLVK